MGSKVHVSNLLLQCILRICSLKQNTKFKALVHVFLESAGELRFID
jgi:chorismate mutase